MFPLTHGRFAHAKANVIFGFASPICIEPSCLHMPLFRKTGYHQSLSTLSTRFEATVESYLLYK